MCLLLDENHTYFVTIWVLKNCANEGII